MISSTFASFLSSEFYSSSLCFSSASSSSYPSLLSHLCFLFCLSFSSSSCLNHRFFSFPFFWRFHNLLINFSEILIKAMRSKSMDFSKNCPERIYFRLVGFQSLKARSVSAAQPIRICICSQRFVTPLSSDPSPHWCADNALMIFS